MICHFNDVSLGADDGSLLVLFKSSSKLEMCPWDTDASAIAKFAKIVNFNKRTITPVGIMRYGPFYIWKKTL